MKGRAIIARGAPVTLPRALAVRQDYPTVAEAEGLFLASIRTYPPRTVDTYRSGMQRFDHFLSVAGIDPFTMTADEAQLPEDVLEHFYRWLYDAGYSRGSIDTYIGGAKAFWRFVTAKRLVPPRFSYDAMRDGLRMTMGKHRVRTPRIDPNLPRIVTYVDELPLLPLEQWDGAARLTLLRDRALLHVLFYSGMRRAEVASLNRGDVLDGTAREALITGKGDKERLAWFDADSLAAIRAYLEARADNQRPLFLRHDNRRGAPGPAGERWRLSLQSVWGIVKTYAAAVGVTATPHHFRHLKASTLLNRGASLSEVQDVLGHASPLTTKQIYAHYQPQVLRAAVERYSASADDLVAELDTSQGRAS